MNTCFHSLDNITPWRDDWRIRVRINRVWSASYGARTRDDNLIHMVLMDDKLTKIEATITQSLIPYFNEVLEEGDVYVIAHFTVVPNSGLTRLTKHRFRIIFHSKTIVVPTMSIGMPNAAFKFTSIDEVVEKRCNEDFLIDFIGFIVGVRQEADIGSDGERMKVIILEVVSDGKKKIQCNLIGRSCEVFDLSMLRKYQRPPVVVLEAFKIKVFGDYVCLQNVINISTVLINPDIYESVEFLSRFNVACYEFSRFIPIVSGYLIASVGDDSVDWRAIRSIDQLKKNCQDGIFYVMGTITEVVDDSNWWYHSCVCGNAVVADDNSYHCDICDSCVEHVVLKYRITVIVDDGTSSAAFALVDNAATKLFGKTCAEAFLHMEKELHLDWSDISRVDQSSRVPLFHRIIETKIVFKVKMHSVFGPHYSDQFKVVNLFGDVAEPCLPVQSLNEFIHCPIFNPIYPSYSAASCIQNSRCQISLSGLIETEPIGEMLGEIISLCFSQRIPEIESLKILVGTISYVFEDHEWWLATCLCGSAVSVVNGSPYCVMCQIDCVDTIPKYSLKVIVSYRTRNNILVLGDSLVARILMKKCATLLEENPISGQTLDKKIVPQDIISHLIEKKFAFIVDPRIVGYELNMGVYIVRDFTDESCIVTLLESVTQITD